jgi:hypothetical protein
MASPDDAGTPGAFDAGKIVAQGAEFRLLAVERIHMFRRWRGRRNGLVR